MVPVMLLTWREILRRRVFLVTVLLTSVFLILYGWGLSYVARAGERAPSVSNLLDQYLQGAGLLVAGVFFANFMVAFLVIFSSAGTISGEIESGILYSILPRPVERWQVYLGKWAGLAIWGLLYAGVLFWALVWMVHLFLDFPLDMTSLLRAFVALELIPLVLSAVTLLGSAYLPTLGNGVAVTLLYGLALLGGLMEQFMSVGSSSSAGERIGLVTSLLMPSDALYRRMVYEVTAGSGIPVGDSAARMLGPFASLNAPSDAFLVYVGVYIVAVLLWGCLRFTWRDI
ncbi:ABC transporter permease [Kyrpidia spormannii]|nr:ABC transporter permease subunit [Kyrpidia spormannii]